MLELNHKKVPVTMFPDRTSQVWKLDNIKTNDDETNIVWWWFEQEYELFHLLQLNQLLSETYASQQLFIPYLPYARQDKIIKNDQTFALRSMIKVMQTMYWDDIFVFDPHSNVFEVQIEHAGIHQSHVSKIEPDLSFVKDYDFVILPDKGAHDRYKYLIPSNTKVGYGEKVRDQQSGWITHYELISDEVCRDKTDRIIVIDDLCDGGATFNILAKNLDWAYRKPDLYVSHGLFSKGVNELLENYGKIYTTDSCYKGINWNNAYLQSLVWQEKTRARLNGRLIFQSVQEIMERKVSCMT